MAHRFNSVKGSKMSIDTDELKDILKDVLNEGRHINDEVHSIHHTFVANQIQSYENRREMLKKFKLTFIGAMAIGFASGLAWIGKLVLEAVGK